MKENDEYYQRSGFALPKYIYLYSFDILKMNLKISLFHNSLCYVDEQIAESFIEKINNEKDLLEIALSVIEIVPEESEEYPWDDYYNVWFSSLEEKHEMRDSEIDNFVKEYLNYVFDKREKE